jgi:hypothetical protein
MQKSSWGKGAGKLRLWPARAPTAPPSRRARVRRRWWGAARGSRRASPACSAAASSATQPSSPSASIPVSSALFPHLPQINHRLQGLPDCASCDYSVKNLLGSIFFYRFWLPKLMLRMWSKVHWPILCIMIARKMMATHSSTLGSTRATAE